MRDAALTAPPSPVRLAELMASLSMATDLGMGQPLEYALTTCVVAMRLGGALGLADADLRNVYYEALLRYIGCNAETYWLASLVGDELSFRTDIASVDSADDRAILALVMRHIRQAQSGAGLATLAQAMLQGLVQLPLARSSFFPGHCEVAQRLATRLGFPETFTQTIGQLYARWDGKGVPSLKGEAISPALLVVALAQDAVTFYRLGGVEAAVAMARERRGGAHAPAMVDLFCQQAPHLLADLDEEPTWETALALEPTPHQTLSEAQLDNACEVMADFTDIKSPYFLNHSRRVADLASAAAARCGLPPADIRAIRRAGLLHDIGKVGISAGIWGKSGPLSQREWDKVRLHPYYTERVLARPAALAHLGGLASLHHERLDGSGYYRNLAAPMLTPAARVLATANLYCSQTEQRPYRPAASPEAVADSLKREALAGRLDGEIVKAVLASAGHRPVGRADIVAGLSEREVEVLRLIAQGLSIKQMAERLVIAPKTVDNHIQHIYAKTGVTTRAGATLFAMENGLL